MPILGEWSIDVAGEWWIPPGGPWALFDPRLASIGPGPALYGSVE